MDKAVSSGPTFVVLDTGNITVLQGAEWIKMRGKTPTASLQAIHVQSHQSQQQLLRWRTSPLALKFFFSFFPTYHPSTRQLIKPLVLSSIHTKMNPSFPVRCCILKVSWVLTSPSFSPGHELSRSVDQSTVEALLPKR